MNNRAVPLQPLKQWICDRCAGLIERPEDGCVHWRRDEARRFYEFTIIHRVRSSPLGGDFGCHPQRIEQDADVLVMLGHRGLVRLLAMMDVGRYHDPDGRDVGQVKDIRGWTEVFRRLHLPYYEEARLYFEEVRASGDFDGINEIALLNPDTLKQIVDDHD